MYQKLNVTLASQGVLRIPADQVGKLVYDFQLPHKETEAALEILMVLAMYDRQIGELKHILDALEKRPLCCGVFEERDNGSVLVVHGVRDACPYPGHEAVAGQRRGPRRYVRREDRQMILDAQARYVEVQRLRRELHILDHGRLLVADKLRVGHETAVLAMK